MAEKTTKKDIPSDLSLRERLTTRSKDVYGRGTHFIKRRPLTSFLLVLGLLLVILLVSKLTQQAPDEKPTQKLTKSVQVYSIGEGPQATFQAKIEKSGVVQIMAQSPGIVRRIDIKEGEKVNEGQQIISLASNYQGGNASSVQREIAQTQYQNILDTFGDQNQLIQKQRDIATASAENAQQTRDITRQSVDETRNLINVNQTQLDQANQSLQTLQQNNPAGNQQPGALNQQPGALNQQPGALNQQPGSIQNTAGTMQSTVGQLESGVNTLRQSLRNIEYQAANDKPPAQLANFQKELALKQLDVQSKTLELNKEVARLQVSLAYVNEAVMYPSSPFTGIVERIAVKEGQSVTAGTLLATVTANDVESTAILLVPQNVAQAIKLGEPSHIMINDKSIAVTPYYVSSQATDGQLYSVFYKIPKDKQKDLSDGDYISIQVPLGAAKTTSFDPLIPIDAVYQTQDQAYVMVANKNKAENKIIKPGQVFGNYVQVQSGLNSGDQIIMNRNVIAEDKVKIQ